MHEVLVEDVRRVGEEVRPEVLALGPAGELVEVLHHLPAPVLPGEVRVGLGEADLRQLAHDGAAGERLGQEDHVAVVRVDLFDQPLPERDRLRVRVVDAEDLDPEVDPVDDDPPPLLPHRLPGRRVPVEVVDVLVALGRVLGVLQRAVGALQEPLRVLGQPRVVGRRVERQVDRHVHVVIGRRLAQAADVLERAELRVDGVVAALGAADRVRRARVLRAGDERVVAALAVLDADRVDRRDVEHVEAELREARELGLDVLQAAEGAREQLVPGAEAGPDAVDVDRERRVVRGRAVALRAALDGGEQLVAERGVVLGRLGDVLVLEDPQHVLEQLAVAGLLRAAGGVPEQDGALGQLAGEVVVLRGEHLALELVAPGGEDVGPGLDRVLPAAGAIDREPAAPAHAADLRVELGELGLRPFLLTGGAVLDGRAQDVVAVAEDVGRDRDHVPDAALGGEPPAVDGRLGVLDDDPRWERFRCGTFLRWGHSVGKYPQMRDANVVLVTTAAIGRRGRSRRSARRRARRSPR